MSYSEDTILVRQNKLFLDITKKVRFTQGRYFFYPYSKMIYDKKKNCSDIMTDHSWDFVGHEQIFVSQCLMTDCYLQPCNVISPLKVFRHHKPKII